jgi:hypothetical protein
VASERAARKVFRRLRRRIVGARKAADVIHEAVRRGGGGGGYFGNWSLPSSCERHHCSQVSAATMPLWGAVFSLAAVEHVLVVESLSLW